MPDREQPRFATFWDGQTVSAMEAACLASFVRHGYALTVYSYGAVANLPSGLEVRDASEIVEQRFKDAFLIKGRPSLSHFSDLFRYRLFQHGDAIWVDSDIYLLRRFATALPATVLAREDAKALCGAVMRLSADDPALGRLVTATEAMAGRDIEWGATGPRLLTRIMPPEIMNGALGPEAFFPVHYDDFWKVLLPEHREECDRLCREATTLHLWNNIVTKLGFWKELLPPEGSFLGDVLTAEGMAPLFIGTYPAAVMRMMVENYRMRLSGSFADLPKLVRVALPGLRRRAARKVNYVRDRIAGRL